MNRRPIRRVAERMSHALRILAPERHRRLLFWIGRGVQTPPALAEKLGESVELTARALARLIEENFLEYRDRKCVLAGRVTFHEDNESVELAVALPGGSGVAIKSPKHLI